MAQEAPARTKIPSSGPATDCAVPGPAVCLIGQHLRQRRVGGLAAGQRLRLQHPGTHQRVPEPHAALVDAEQPHVGGPAEYAGTDRRPAELRRRSSLPKSGDVGALGRVAPCRTSLDGS